MDFSELCRKRYSVRKFSGKKVEQEKLALVLEAGRLAPTAVNFQPQRVLVLNTEDTLAKLKLCTHFHFDAPLALIVSYDVNTSWKNPDGKDIGIVDASIITTQMMYEATELGLGTTWVGHFDSAALREQFNIPEYLMPVAILPIGYAAEDAAPHPVLHFSRLDLKETVFYNSYDGVSPGENHAGQH